MRLFWSLLVAQSYIIVSWNEVDAGDEFPPAGLGSTLTASRPPCSGRPSVGAAEILQRPSLPTPVSGCAVQPTASLRWVRLTRCWSGPSRHHRTHHDSWLEQKMSLDSRARHDQIWQLIESCCNFFLALEAQVHKSCYFFNCDEIIHNLSKKCSFSPTVQRFI